jgi:hypothetical protein
MIMTNGNPIDPELLHTARSRTIAAMSVRNLQDLLKAIDETPPNPKRPKAMLRFAAKLVSDCLEKGFGEVEIDELIPLRPRLKLYLQAHRYPRNTVKSYLNYARMLVVEARQFGWVSLRPDVTKEWEKIRQCVWSRQFNATQIVNYAVSIGKTPGLFAEKDLKEWQDLKAAQGMSARYPRDVAALFRNRIFKAGLGTQLPNLSRPRYLGYGVPLGKIPRQLRTQIEELLKWKTDEVSDDRNRHGRLRPISAFKFQQFICRFYGYVSKLPGKPALNLRTLFDKKSVIKFINWGRKERQLKKKSLYVPLGTLYGIVRHYPYFKRGNFEWLGKLIAQLEPDEEDESRVKEARNLKSVDYDLLEGLPERMRREAAKMYANPSKQYAVAMRDALLMEWLVTLPWRQRNLREMRVGRQEDQANIFKARLSDNDGLARPGWLVEELRRNPNVEVWQFHFRALETKNKHPVRGILPKQIAAALEDYVNNLRPLLISGSDPGTVFLNDSGRSYSRAFIYTHVTDITFRYLRRPINPHLFRHIYAKKFLVVQPENYLTLSKILWHLNVQITIRLYGAGYDESHGAKAAEEFRDRGSTPAPAPATTGYCGRCGQPVTGRFCANCGNPTGR